MTAPSLFVSWQHPTDRQWFVVGKLRDVEGGYEFVYTQGVDDAQEAGFVPLAEFPDLDELYASETLFSTFANRLPPPSRPDYADFVSWLHLPAGEASPILLLDRYGGARQTDNLELFRDPTPDADGVLQASFFLRGLRHRHEMVQQACATLEPGDQLFIGHDFQNIRDDRALTLSTQEDIFTFGHVPRFLAPVVHQLREADATDFEVTVQQVNPPPAPAQLRLLCRFEARNVPSGLPIFSEPQYQTRHPAEAG